MFFHNIDITVCTENSGIANGKRGTSSYAGRRMLMNGIKKNVFIKKIVGSEKDKKSCTANVNSLGPIAHICAHLFRTFGARSAYTRGMSHLFFPSLYLSLRV